MLLGCRSCPAPGTGAEPGGDGGGGRVTDQQTGFIAEPGAAVRREVKRRRDGERGSVCARVTEGAGKRNGDRGG